MEKTRNSVLDVLARNRTLAATIKEDSPALCEKYEDSKGIVDGILAELQGKLPNQKELPDAERVRDIAEVLEEEIEHVEDICRRIGYYRGFSDGKAMHEEL